MKKETIYYKSPLGWLEICTVGKALVSIRFKRPHNQALIQCSQELDQYFRGQRKQFSLMARQPGTIFERQVWRQLKKIPWGKTASYEKIATQIGRKKAVRAVASAIGRNQIPIVIPCHRVISKNGSISGYAGGVLKKRQLLNLEGIRL